MSMLERVEEAVRSGARFFVCFQCTRECRECLVKVGHTSRCSVQRDLQHGRHSSQELLWVSSEEGFAWPYIEEDCPAGTEAFHRGIPSEAWRRNVRRTGGKWGAYIKPAEHFASDIHSRRPPFIVHVTGMSGTNRTVPVLQMNGKPSNPKLDWRLDFCVDWNLLSHNWHRFNSKRVFHGAAASGIRTGV